MATSNKKPAIKFTAKDIIKTLIKAAITANSKALCGNILFAGMGRFCVLFIKASTSLSYHILTAPAAPEPSAMQKTAINATTG